MAKGYGSQMPSTIIRDLAHGTIDREPSLFPCRVTTRYPGDPIGKNHAFRCEAGRDGTFHCKDDAFDHPVRAVEWLYYSLARLLNIAVPEFRVVEDNGETFFGSRQDISTSSSSQLSEFLGRRSLDELGRPTWLGQHLSRLAAFDLFINNPDRTVQNFVLQRDGSLWRLCAIDFADARLSDITSDLFPIAASNTMMHGRRLRSLHGFCHGSACKMVDDIAAVPSEVVRGILRGMPDDWMLETARSTFLRSWGSEPFRSRISALKLGLADGKFF